MLQHVWFQSIDISKLEEREIKPDFLPDITRANCDTNAEDLSALFLPPPIEEPLAGMSIHYIVKLLLRMCGVHDAKYLYSIFCIDELQVPFKEYSSFAGDRKRMFESGKFIPSRPTAFRRMSKRIVSSNGSIAPLSPTPERDTNRRFTTVGDVDRKSSAIDLENKGVRSPAKTS